MGILLPVTETSNRQGVLNPSVPKLYGIPYISKVRDVNGRTTIILDGKKVNEERIVSDTYDDLSVLLATSYSDFGLALTVNSVSGNKVDNYPVSLVIKASSIVEAYDNTNGSGGVVRVRDEDLKEDIFYFTTEDIAAIQALVPANPASRPYTVYSAIITQAGEDAPVPAVLENTVGSVVWARTGAGTYTATFPTNFVEDKYFIGNDLALAADQNPISVIVTYAVSGAIVTVNTFQPAVGLVDEILNNPATSRGIEFEVRIYP